MKKLLHSYPNFVIGTLAIVFLGTLIGFYLQAVNGAVTQLRSALVPPQAQNAQGFDLQGASHLDLRGLINTSTASSSGN